MKYLWDIILLSLSAVVHVTCGIELTFELPDNERQCFHEVVDRRIKCTLEFQVGGAP